MMIGHVCSARMVSERKMANVSPVLTPTATTAIPTRAITSAAAALTGTFLPTPVNVASA